MPKKKFAAAVLAFGALGIACLGLVRGAPPETGTNTALPRGPLIGKLDDLGHSLFGGIFQDNTEGQTPQHATRHSTRRPLQYGKQSGTPATSRQGSLFRSSPDGPRTDNKPAPTLLDAIGLRRSAPSTATPAHPSRPGGQTGLRRPVTVHPPATRAMPSSPGGSAASDGHARTPARIPSGSTDPTTRPLHERLSWSRTSVFDQKPAATDATDSPEESLERESTPPPESDSSLPVVRQPNGMTPRRPTPAVPSGPIGARVESASEPLRTRPLIPQHAVPLLPTAEGATPSKLPPPPEATLSATVDPMTGQDRGVLFARKSPMLSVQTLGPQRISVGKESVYEVVLENAGDAEADEVVVFVELPEWTDVVGADPQTGTASPTAGGPVQWKIGHLPANSRQRLRLRIVPRESRPFDLAVRWDYRPVTSQAMIEVQEPKLVLNLDGPSEVLYGEKEIYRMKISNTGTGPAENVMIRLLPIGSGTNQPISHNLGDIAAGDEKAIEVELIARQVGNLTIRVNVQGDAGVHAELAHEVLVRRAALQVSVEGPKVLYVGTMASYLIRVRNPGTAPAENVTLVANIPPGAKYLSGIDGAQLVANGTKLQWTLPSLNPGNEQSYLMKCHLGLPGSSQLEIRATAEGELSDTASAMTRVEAIADLMLEVKDPAGPVAVGEETVYELRIRNRGTKSAHNVEVVTFFSDGIEPTKVEGSPYQISLGQVAFGPITSVAAGEDVVLKVHAKAVKPGNHIFRAEVHCKPLGTRLVSEETTHFYQDEPFPGFTPAEAPIEKRESPTANAVRTAKRPIPQPAYPPRPHEPTPAVRPQ